MEETFHSEHDTCSEHVDPKFINSQFALEDELGATDHADALQENIAISSYLDEEPVYRSVAVEFAPSALPVNVGDACNEGENLYSDESAMQHLEEQRLATQARPYESQCRHGNCAILPEVPCMLMHTNFEVATTSIDRLQRQVTMCLADIEGASFEMSKSCYEVTIIEGPCVRHSLPCNAFDIMCRMFIPRLHSSLTLSRIRSGTALSSTGLLIASSKFVCMGRPLRSSTSSRRTVYRYVVSYLTAVYCHMSTYCKGLGLIASLNKNSNPNPTP